jgi:hypothetical protein
MSDITDALGLVDNGDGTFSDPNNPGVLYDESGYSVGTAPGYDYTTGAPTANTGSSTDVSAGDPYAGYTTGQYSDTVDTGTPPAGATGKSADGKSWINAAGQIIGPVVVSAATPWLNNLQSGGTLKTAENMLASSGTALGNVQAPDLTKLIPQLKLQVMQGQMTPAQAAAAIQQASNMQSVTTDQASLQGQRDALARLAQIGNQGGMTQADQAALTQTMNQAAAKTASDRAAQIQALQQQGNAGTGAELAARLSGVQGGANANALAGAQTAQAAQARALAAIQAGLQGNAALNTQQFSQAAQKAQAQDAINQFNAAAQNAANLANAGYTQGANLANFNTANQIAGTNVGIQNKQAMLPWEASQQNYENQLGLGKAQTAAQLGAGTALGKMATDQIARSSGAGTGAAAGAGAGTAGTTGTGAGKSSAVDNAVNTAVNAGINYVADNTDKIANAAGDAWDWLTSDKNLKTCKEEMSDADVDKLMGQLTAYKYRYKGSPTNPERAGVMAQDLQAGGSNSVVNTPAGKMIEGPNMLSEALAVLANQHERIKKLEGQK